MECMKRIYTLNYSTWSDDVCSEQVTSPLGPAADILLGIYMVCLAVLGLSLNMVVVVTLLKVPRSLSHLELCLVNLAVCGGIPSVASYPFIAAACFHHRWPYGDDGCIRDGFTIFYFGMCSIGNILLISILRYISLCHPSLERRVTHVTVYVLIVVTYVYAAALSVPPLFEDDGFQLEPFRLACSINWVRLPAVYFGLLLTLGYAVPLAVTVGAYAGIWRTVRAASTKSVVKGRQQLCDVYLAKVALVICVSFIVGWTPYALVSFVTTFIGYDPQRVMFSPFPSMFAKATSVSNPLIYYFMIERFRREVKMVLWKLFFGASGKIEHGGSAMPIISTSFRTYRSDSNAVVEPDVTSGSAGDVIAARVGDVIVEAGGDVTPGSDVSRQQRKPADNCTVLALTEL